MSSNFQKQKRIGKHYFRLKGKDNLYFKGEHIAVFKPLPKKQTLESFSKLLKSRCIIPTFNADGRHYTYAFHLPSSPVENQEHMLEEHEKRVREAQAEHSEIWVPKPRSRHKYCGVCRGHYEDYKDHIESELHMTHLKTSRYQQLINNLANDFQRIPRKDQENIIVEVTTEEAANKGLPELVETASLSRGVLT